MSESAPGASDCLSRFPAVEQNVFVSNRLRKLRRA